jgi:hypothetical protein
MAFTGTVVPILRLDGKQGEELAPVRMTQTPNNISKTYEDD